MPLCRKLSLRQLAIVGCLGLVLTPTLEAQRDRRGDPKPASMTPSVGVRGGRYFTFDAWTVGAQVDIPITRELVFAPSADRWTLNDRDNWQVNLDAMLRAPEAGPLSIGVGLALVHREFVTVDEVTTQTDSGLNVLLRLSPVEPAVGIFRPFVETRFTRVTRQNPIQLTVGLTLSPGG